MPDESGAERAEMVGPGGVSRPKAPSLADGLELLWWLVMLLMVLFGLSSLWWSHGADQGTLACVADVIVRGGSQYKDIWDNNGPGGPLQHALLQSMFGNAQWPLRVLDLAYVVVTLLVLAALGRKLDSREAGMWAALLFAVWYVPVLESSPIWYDAAQRDGWASMWVLWGIAAAVLRGGLGWAALSGLCVGAAATFKPFFAAFALPVGLLLWAGRPAERGRGFGLLLQVAMLGGLLLPLVVIVLKLRAAGALRAAWDELFVFNLKVYSHSMQITTERGLRWFLQELVYKHSGQLVPGVLGSACVLAGAMRGRYTLALVYPLVAAAVVAGQIKLYPYHWHTLHLPLALLGGVGVATLARQAAASPEQPARSMQRALLGVLLFVALFNPLHCFGRAVKQWAVQVIVRGDVAAYRRDNGLACGLGGLGYGGHIEIAELLAKHTKPDEPVFVWGADPIVYFLAARPCATRFAATWPIDLTGTMAPDLHRAYIQALLADLQTSPPALFVLVTRAPQPRDPWSDNVGLPIPPELVQWLGARYGELHKAKDFVVYAPVKRMLRRPQAR